MTKQLTWFPGHIAKAWKELKDIDDFIDCYFVLLDARIFKSSFLQEYQIFTSIKQKILIITKIDLVEQTILQSIKKYYSNNLIMFVNLKNPRNFKIQLFKKLDKLNFPILFPKFAILGIPNVGKSTFFNLLTNRKISKTENKAGVTKEISKFVSFANKYWILDAPGLIENSSSSKENITKFIFVGSIPISSISIDELEHYIPFNLQKQKTFNLAYEKINNDINNKEKLRSVIVSFQQLKYGKICLDD